MSTNQIDVDLLAEIRAERKARYDAGEDDSFYTAKLVIAKRHDLCPRCMLGRGTVIVGWQGQTARPILGPCPECCGVGRWTR